MSSDVLRMNDDEVAAAARRVPADAGGDVERGWQSAPRPDDVPVVRRSPRDVDRPRVRKVQNLRRDPRITCLVEAGDVFDEFRAVQIVGRAAIVDGLEEIGSCR